jgi:AraC-like DNA-binding protein
MILNLLNLLCGFSLILIALAILLHYFRSSKINFYFFLLLLFAGFSRFQYGLTSLAFIHEGKPLVLRFFISLFLIPPIFLLCLQSFISEQVTVRKSLLHFSFFGCIVFARILFGELNLFVLGLFFVTYTTFYYFLLWRSSYRYLKQHQTIFSKQQLFKVKQLIIWIFALSINNFVFIVYYLILNPSNKPEAIQHIFDGTVICWTFFLIYLFFNPGIVFNEVFKKKDLDRDFAKEFDIWSSKPLQKTENQDRALELVVRRHNVILLEHLRKLKPEIVIQSSSSNLLSVLSQHLNYPKSHIKFVLKYYCRHSQSDYLNVLRLIHALTLINNGYLEYYTIETLGEHCHFKSRTSFYRHFKRHLGVSPSQYKTLIE